MKCGKRGQYHKNISRALILNNKRTSTDKTLMLAATEYICMYFSFRLSLLFNGVVVVASVVALWISWVAGCYCCSCCATWFSQVNSMKIVFSFFWIGWTYAIGFYIAQSLSITESETKTFLFVYSTFIVYTYTQYSDIYMIFLFNFFFLSILFATFVVHSTTEHFTCLLAHFLQWRCRVSVYIYLNFNFLFWMLNCVY